MAGEKIAEGEIGNAFAFIGAGGHHSGRDFFGGYCCFNDVALCVVNLREKHGFRRFAILDTDAHHGDGTREIFLDDPDILHVCICGREFESPDGTKVDVGFPDPREAAAGRSTTPTSTGWRTSSPTGSAGSVRTSSSGTSVSTPTRATTATSASPGPLLGDRPPDAGSRGGGLRREARGGPRRRFPQAGHVPDPAGHRAAGGARKKGGPLRSMVSRRPSGRPRWKDC